MGLRVRSFNEATARGNMWPWRRGVRGPPHIIIIVRKGRRTESGNEVRLRARRRERGRAYQGRNQALFSSPPSPLLPPFKPPSDFSSPLKTGTTHTSSERRERRKRREGGKGGSALLTPEEEEEEVKVGDRREGGGRGLAPLAQGERKKGRKEETFSLFLSRVTEGRKEGRKGVFSFFPSPPPSHPSTTFSFSRTFTRSSPHSFSPSSSLALLCRQKIY